MRKRQRLAALLLLLLTAAGLWGCAKDRRKELYGDWVLETDFSSEMKEALGGGYETFEEALPIQLRVSFYEDGSFAVGTQGEPEASVDAWLCALAVFCEGQLYEEYAARDMGREELDTLIEEELGMEAREYFYRLILQQVDIKAVTEAIAVSGVYDVKKDRLYLGERETEEESFDYFSVEDGSLTITPASDGEGEEPIILRREESPALK